MKSRKLYLAAYDISQSWRLRQFLRLLREYSGQGQKSVFECWLSRKEKNELIQRACELMDMETDRFMLFRLHGQLPVLILGKASKPSEEHIVTFL